MIEMLVVPPPETTTISWHMPAPGTPDLVTWPQPHELAADSGEWCQVDVYPTGPELDAILADGVLSQGEDTDLVISWSFELCNPVVVVVPPVEPPVVVPPVVEAPPVVVEAPPAEVAPVAAPAPVPATPKVVAGPQLAETGGFAWPLAVFAAGLIAVGSTLMRKARR